MTTSSHPPLAEPVPPPIAGEEASALLLQYLATSDQPCPGCGYNLRGLTTARCPECNEALRLQAGLVEPKLAWFIVGVVGLAMGAGFGLLVFGAVVVQRLVSRWRATSIWEGWPILLTGVVCALMTWGWVALRRRLNNKPAPLRWGLAIGTHIWSIALAVLCVLFVR